MKDQAAVTQHVEKVNLVRSKTFLDSIAKS